MGMLRVVTMLVLATALVGCGGEPAKAPSAATSSKAATSKAGAPTPSPTPEGNGPMVPDLPDLSRFPTPTPVRPQGLGRSAGAHGADVSWPQCPKGMGIPEKRSEGAPMPTAAARFVVIGLTNGPSFFPNPCLASQLRWVKDRGLLAAAYAVVSYPDAATLAALGAKGPYDGKDRLGALRNVGFQAAMFNVQSMRTAGFSSPIVWIDVEPVSHFPWSDDTAANAAVVEGTVRGYRDAGYAIGFYSTPHMWTRIVGGWRHPAPEWRPAGSRGEPEALRRCADDWSFAGGRGVIGQWVEAGRDRNVMCPGAGDLGRWFHNP